MSAVNPDEIMQILLDAARHNNNQGVSGRSGVGKRNPGRQPNEAVSKRKQSKYGRYITKRGKERALKIADLRAQGKTWDEVGEELGYRNSAGAYLAYKKALESGWMQWDADELKQVQQRRLEIAWKGLEPKIQAGRERAVEVGIKVLERQARLHGIDAADAQKNQQSNQPINIVITADPRDDAARKLVGSGESALAGGSGSRQLLSPPIEGLPLPEEDHSPGGGDG